MNYKALNPIIIFCICIIFIHSQETEGGKDSLVLVGKGKTKELAKDDAINKLGDAIIIRLINMDIETEFKSGSDKGINNGKFDQETFKRFRENISSKIKLQTLYNPDRVYSTVYKKLSWWNNEWSCTIKYTINNKYLKNCRDGKDDEFIPPIIKPDTCYNFILEEKQDRLIINISTQDKVNKTSISNELNELLKNYNKENVELVFEEGEYDFSGEPVIFKDKNYYLNVKNNQNVNFVIDKFPFVTNHSFFSINNYNPIRIIFSNRIHFKYSKNSTCIIFIKNIHRETRIISTEIVSDKSYIYSGNVNVEDFNKIFIEGENEK